VALTHDVVVPATSSLAEEFAGHVRELNTHFVINGLARFQPG
jgi:hypothetical protein